MTSSLIWQSGLIACGLLVAMALRARADEPPPEPDHHKHTNALIDSSSPYLLQHAHNPVNWMPWSPAAFAQAKAEHKPIFVSIGYSTCYWCHVMERESFENEEVAAVLNEHYIAIKVDREQRPDIDEQLMLATQLMAGRGGWPNSVWLTSDGRPWMAGTYFPRPQFIGALEQLAQVWKNEPEAVQKQADGLSAAIREAAQFAGSKSTAQPSGEPLQKAVSELARTFDAQHGGFGSKPKFPPHGGLRLLAFAARQGDTIAKTMLTATLDGMWRGGIHDHVGGGFHRYSTDERWFLPHFEKMLYDNAQLMRAYAEGYEIKHAEGYDVTQAESYRRAVLDIYGWVSREMTHPAGGFYSALDSESDGEEGRYNTWSMAELRKVLTEQESQEFATVYNFQPPGNFTEEASGKRPGTNIPYLSETPDAALELSLSASREKLLAARVDREYPHLDDKVLTSWNGLMISSLAYSGRILHEPQLVDAAARAAEFILAELNPNEGLLHTWRAGQASVPGYLDDYAFFIEGLLELHSATGEARWLAEAEKLAQQMRSLFEDKVDGGFYFTSEQHEELLLRSKNLMGGGNLPVGNGVALQVLLELHHRTGDAESKAAALRGLRAFSALMLASPRQVEHLVLANAEFVAANDKSATSQASSEMPAAQATHEDASVRAGLYLSHDALAPDQAMKVAVRIQIVEGQHLYGKTPNHSAPIVRETRVRMLPTVGLKAGELQSPEGSTALDPVLDMQLTTYTGEVWFVLPVQVTQDAEVGPTELQFELEYQACDASKCFPPQRVVLVAKLALAKEASGQPLPQYQPLFDRLK